MRLLDQVSQSTTPLTVPGSSDTEVWRLPSACDLAPGVRQCPARYVLDDELARLCTELAFSDGDHLARCLDLIHLPETNLWIEWNDAARQQPLGNTTPSHDRERDLTGRAGVLLSATPDGRKGRLRTFWSEDPTGEPALAPMETHVDLDREWPENEAGHSVFEGGWAMLRDPEDPGLDALLDCLRFRFDPPWAAYYRSRAATDSHRAEILRKSLASVSRDIPMLMAFFLLLTSRDGLPQRTIECSRLNRKRAARGKTPLLDHVEVRAPLELLDNATIDPTHEPMTRASPRRHRVRGHLVRRGNTLTWRRSHTRGTALRGVLASRTVTFSFGRSSSNPTM